MKIPLVITLAIVCAITGCSSTSMNKSPWGEQKAAEIPSPTAAVKDPVTIPTPAKIDAPATIDLPPWYVKAPASTEQYLFITGTGISSDLSMSRNKALLDAQTLLASKLNGIVDAVIRQQRKDSSGDLTDDYTSMSVRKRILDTSITGYHVEDTRVVSEDKKYRSFVLLRYPLQDANRLLKQKTEQDSQKKDAKNPDKEIDKEISNANKPVVSDSKPNTQTSSAEVRPIAPNTTVVEQNKPVPVNQLQLLDVENEEYKKRRAEALQKPGAVVGRITLQ